ncbi:hypothetical protein OC861_003524 [Tilletia horrida]|nr:hypothetical protein OC861_003524 [Tilletia horrida]
MVRPEYDPSEPPTSFYEFITLRHDRAQSVGRDFHFTTVFPPRPFGSYQAFGGSVLAPCVQAAFTALQQITGDVEAAHGFVPFSFQGSFVGPSRLNVPLEIQVKTLRFTRTFATFLIIVFQLDASETEQRSTTESARKAMVAVFDFIRPGPSFLQFGPTPREPVKGGAWTDVERLPSYYDEIERRENDPDQNVSAIAVVLERLSVADWAGILEQRLPPESLLAQSMGGIVSSLPTCQDHLPPTHKRGADWSRYTTPFTPQGIAADPFAQLASESGSDVAVITPASANAAAIAHLADTKLAWFAPSSAKFSMLKLELTVTLEFSLRYHTGNLRADEWMLREMKSITAGEGRSFSEARFFDRAGRLLATMTQQCLLRQRRSGNTPKLKL